VSSHAQNPLSAYGRGPEMRICSRPHAQCGMRHAAFAAAVATMALLAHSCRASLKNPTSKSRCPLAYFLRAPRRQPLHCDRSRDGRQEWGCCRCCRGRLRGCFRRTRGCGRVSNFLGGATAAATSPKVADRLLSRLLSRRLPRHRNSGTATAAGLGSPHPPRCSHRDDHPSLGTWKLQAGKSMSYGGSMGGLVMHGRTAVVAGVAAEVTAGVPRGNAAVARCCRGTAAATAIKCSIGGCGGAKSRLPTRDSGCDSIDSPALAAIAGCGRATAAECGRGYRGPMSPLPSRDSSQCCGSAAVPVAVASARPLTPFVIGGCRHTTRATCFVNLSSGHPPPFGGGVRSTRILRRKVDPSFEGSMVRPSKEAGGSITGGARWRRGGYMSFTAVL
jgi:hypothetical protein